VDPGTQFMGNQEWTNNKILGRCMGKITQYGKPR
jgi:hypothetical protein